MKNASISMDVKSADNTRVKSFKAFCRRYQPGRESKHPLRISAGSTARAAARSPCRSAFCGTDGNTVNNGNSRGSLIRPAIEEPQTERQPWTRILKGVLAKGVTKTSSVRPFIRACHLPSDAGRLVRAET